MLKQLNLERIKERRVEKGLSTTQMANILGFKDPSTYWNYENGKYRFKADMLPILANTLNCEIEYFFNQ